VTETTLAGRIKAGLDRSRAVEMGVERGLGRPAVLVATTLAAIIDVLMTPLGYLVVWIESSLGWALDGILAPLALVLALPYLGRILAWIWSILGTLFWAGVAVPDGLLSAVGVLAEKRLRVHVMLPPEADDEMRAKMLQALQLAAQIYRKQANVRLMPANPWSMQGAFAGPAEPTAAWLAVGHPDIARLDLGCALRAASEDMGCVGGRFAWHALRYHVFGVARRLLGTGAPIIVFGVQSVDGGRLAGCSLGPLTDYVTVATDQPICVAHELGHACNLPHTPTLGNLMYPTCGGVRLTSWQVVLVRLSRHVSYL
jgi:hypothetical protein